MNESKPSAAVASARVPSAQVSEPAPDQKSPSTRTLRPEGSAHGQCEDYRAAATSASMHSALWPPNDCYLLADLKIIMKSGKIYKNTIN